MRYFLREPGVEAGEPLFVRFMKSQENQKPNAVNEGGYER